ncbi:GNAT family N-acetyltransferase [Salirhabdus sp. Marseille-P4669]|uniref:GNAT family N-acetyltransferase n=1 Tax=Salirhabdus sp. Marseille-P4669 TaxID=2042310 RepID=UPI000C7CCEB3|nr:GNAT family N-acetyltransferase [Salirhabdus sp. Marseille-P4669]
MHIVIREAKANDIKQIQDIAKKSWHATYEGIIPNAVQERFLQSAYSDEMMKKRLLGSFLFVAEVEKKVVGFANFSPVKEIGEVELGAIYIYPEYQGMGIGSHLLHKGIHHIDGVQSIYINVEKDNTIGRTFYEAKGFQLVEEFDDDFDGHTLKTVRMVLQV